MKILIFGSSGQLGKALSRELKNHNLILVNKKKCDIKNTIKLKQIIKKINPNLLINAAAYTNVDKAEKNKKEALKINCFAPKIMAEEAKNLNIPFLHFSTDFVFDGRRQYYSERCKKNPINFYGISKSRGEEEITKIGGHYFIFRTSWVYSNERNNFYLTIKEKVRNKKDLFVVKDQKSIPTPSIFLAKKIKEIIPHLFKLKKSGIYHLTPNGECTKINFAKIIVKKVNPKYNIKNILPISSKELFDHGVKRPKNSVLKNNKIKETFNLKIQTWQYYFEKYF